MPQDVENLKQFKQALQRFVHRQHDVLQSMGQEIRQVRSELDVAEREWRRRASRAAAQVRDCHQERDYAANDGFHVDCSGPERDLDYAEWKLRQLRDAQRKLHQTEKHLRALSERYGGDTLGKHLRQGTVFIDKRIRALEAYYATNLLGAAVSLATSGVTGMYGLLSTTIKHTDAKLKSTVGSLGEEIAAQVLTEQYGLQELDFDQPHQGIDRVFSAPGIPLIVVESKTSSDGEIHLRQTKTGQQGSAEWIADNAERMTNPESAQYSPANERLGHLIKDIGPENVPSIAVVTNLEINTADVYFRTENNEWKLLDSGIDIGEFLNGSDQEGEVD